MFIEINVFFIEKKGKILIFFGKFQLYDINQKKAIKKFFF